MTKEHIQRKFEIGRWALPYNSPQRELAISLCEKNKKDPKYQKLVKKAFLKAIARILAQQENGINYPIDKQLRYFLSEYNNRNMSTGLTSMPLNFNVMEAFFEYDPAISTFLLKQEKDNLFSIIDFLDYYTSPKYEETKQSIKDCLEENVIYSFNNSDPIGSFDISASDNNIYSFAGMSIIRDGNEISCLVLCGRKTNTDQETIKLNEQGIIIDKDFIPDPAKKELKPDPDLKFEAVPLLGDKNYWQGLALSRFDISTSTIDVKYLLQDYGNTFSIITDDLQAFTNNYGEFESDKLKETYIQSLTKMAEFKAIFELSKSLIYVPVYFNAFNEIIQEEKHPTLLGLNKDKPVWRKKINRLGKNHKIFYRTLSVLEKTCGQNSTNISLRIPDIKTETSGFWKTLPYNSVGRDKNGNKIHGRTWVQKSLTWIEENIEQEIIIHNETNLQGTGDNPGYIYLMRNAAHDKDIFKIGLTSRDSEIRSKELSRTTSSPDHFLVAKDWFVKDCIKAEKIIHDRLSFCRINPAREFFKGDFSIFINIIQHIVEEINSNNCAL